MFVCAFQSGLGWSRLTAELEVPHSNVFKRANSALVHVGMRARGVYVCFVALWAHGRCGWSQLAAPAGCCSVNFPTAWGGASYFRFRCQLFLGRCRFLVPVIFGAVPEIGAGNFRGGAGYWCRLFLGRCRLLVPVIFGAVPATVPVTVPAAVPATVPVTVPVIGAGYFSGREIVILHCNLQQK